MLTTVPVTVWEQIPVIVLFSVLFVGGALMMVRAFTKAVADINAHYAAIIENNNAQWQKYFDARSATNTVVNDQMVDKLENLTAIIAQLVVDFQRHDSNFARHDAVELSMLEQMSVKRKNTPDGNPMNKQT